jgi:hypothetical protein
MDRDQAWEIVCEFVKSDSLRKHMLAVEACVAFYARKAGEDEEKWAVAALLHDFDWEIHPNLPDHPIKGEAILAERGVSEESRRANSRGGNGVGQEEAQGQGVRAGGESRRHPERRGATGGGPGSAHLVLHRGDEGAGGGTGIGGWRGGESVAQQ